MFQRLQEFILVWPGDENLQVGFNGDVFIVPPHDVVAEPGPGSPYRNPAAKDRDGRPIPGTIALHDIIQSTGPGGRGHRKALDAAEACAFMEDSRDDLFHRGFSIVMDPDDVPAAMAEGRPKYDAAQVDRARQILYDELERRKKWDAKGIPPPPSSSDHLVRWAKAHLDSHARKSQQEQISDTELRKALGGELPDLGMPAEHEVKPRPKPVPAAKAEPLSVPELWQMAQAAGVNLVKADMVKLLDGDEDFRARLIEEIAEKQEGERDSA
jgi:hypothetical protein